MKTAFNYNSKLMITILYPTKVILALSALVNMSAQFPVKSWCLKQTKFILLK